MMSGCAGITSSGDPVILGEKLHVDYICAIDGKGLVDTSIKEVAQDQSIRKSRIFTERQAYFPLLITAGRMESKKETGTILPFYQVLRDQIDAGLVGKNKNLFYEMIFDPGVFSGVSKRQRYDAVDRVRQVPRTRVLNADRYKKDHGEAPVAGTKLYTDDGQAYAEITAVNNGKYTLKLIINEHLVKKVPWGTARIEGDDKKATVTIDSKVGMLVRDGYRIGRVVEITDNTIVVDYGHPFGGYPLKCRVKAFSEDDAQARTDQKEDLQ